MTTNAELSKWSERHELWQSKLAAASYEWKSVSARWNAARDAGDGEAEKELWTQYEAAWRERCIVCVYEELAHIRMYMEEFDLALPGVTIPDSLFE